MSDLDPIPCDNLKKPDEPFHGDLGNYPALKLLDYWRWSGSCLMDNTARGMLAEFLVAAACGLHTKPRVEWESYDLCTSGGTKIEVKSTAAVQSWKQAAPSPLEFDIAKRRRWDYERGVWSPTADRWADLYVFCVLDGTDPLNVEAWQFYVLSRDVLDQQRPNGEKIRLKPLCRELSPHQCSYRNLKGTIEKVSAETRGPATD